MNLSLHRNVVVVVALPRVGIVVCRLSGVVKQPTDCRLQIAAAAAAAANIRIGKQLTERETEATSCGRCVRSEFKRARKHIDSHLFCSLSLSPANNINVAAAAAAALTLMAGALSWPLAIQNEAEREREREKSFAAARQNCHSFSSGSGCQSFHNAG